MSERNQIRLAGVFCVVVGSSVCLIALGIIPYEESRIHAPTWVILLCGNLFVLGGLALLFESNRLIVNVLGNLIVLSFAAVAAWIALYGPSEQFSGGVPFLSRPVNVEIGRIFFGLGSVLCALMLIPGIRHTLVLLRSKDV